MNLEEYLSSRRGLAEKALDEMLPREDNEAAVLYRAMKYSLFAGGKRIRPILAMAAAEAVGAKAEAVLPVAISVECIHTYSLIHDDLPVMDDDDLRRGKPALHKAFGEAVAILAGDALLSFAFEVLSSPAATRVYPRDRLLAVIHELAVASGCRKLVAGQIVDVASEGKPAKKETVDFIIRGKTAALIRAALTCGAVLGGGNSEQVRVLGSFGDDLGAVFQIRDDLLDLEGDPSMLGKAVKKDEGRGKATYPNLVGKDEARGMIKSLVNACVATIKPLGRPAEPLALIAAYLGDRIN